MPVPAIYMVLRRSMAGVLLLLVHYLLLLPLFCGDLHGPCFVMQYIVSFLVLWKRELVALLNCLLMPSDLVFCASS